MTVLHRHFMELAVAEAIKCPAIGSIGEPKVGAVVVTRTNKVAAGHRGERDDHPDEHAEYVVIKHKLNGEDLTGATVYTTLEPCTDRSPEKTPCVQHIIEARASQVWIGMLDPNPEILGYGIEELLDANVNVGLFDSDLMRKLLDLNREFRYIHKRHHNIGAKNRKTFDPFCFKIANRYILAAFGKKYHSNVDADKSFPLITKTGWLEPCLVRAAEVDSKIAWLPRCEEGLSALMLPLFEGGTCEEWSKKQDSRIEIDPLPAFRMLSCTPGNNGPEFAFSDANYLEYYNNCEALAFELSNACAGTSPVDIKIDKSELPARHALGDVASNLKSRCAVAGLNAIFVIFDGPNGVDEFFLHDRPMPRNEDVLLAEAQDVWHVVPAGSFQRASSGNTVAQDRSIERCILRELAQELVDEEGANEAIRNGRDFLAIPKMKRFAEAKDRGDLEIFYLGFGLDPVTTKPEILLLVGVNARAARINDYESVFTSNWEGKYFLSRWSENVLEQLARSPKLLPAGAACLLRARAHYDVITKYFKAKAVSHEGSASV